MKGKIGKGSQLGDSCNIQARKGEDLTIINFLLHQKECH